MRCQGLLDLLAGLQMLTRLIAAAKSMQRMLGGGFQNAKTHRGVFLFLGCWMIALLGLLLIFRQCIGKLWVILEP